MDASISPQAALRLGAFIGVLGLLLLAEACWPRRGGADRGQRWPANLAMVVLGTVLVRLLLPLGAVGTARWAGASGVGLLNLWPVHPALAALLAFVALDLAIYWQHRLMHAMPMLWRLHRMHHSDLAFDASTALRFHPLEILLSMALKMAVVALLGAPAAAVVAFEIALSASALWSHADLAVPAALDRSLRRIIVTPDMHRVHHSVQRVEHNRNFGFNLSCWDRLFGSYTDQPAGGHVTMQIGLKDFRDPADQRLGSLLAQPLREINRVRAD